MLWFQRKPKITKNFEELTETYNAKYGDFNYDDDSRSLDNKFNQTLIKAVGDIADLNVVVCGSNSGYEIKILSELFPNAQFSAVDISTQALNKLGENMPNVRYLHANMEATSFKNKEFDVYINCRAIHSTDVDIKKALEEAIRITKSKIVISISNGYKVNNNIVKGMYDYNSEKIDPDKPFKIAELIKDYLSEYKLEYSEMQSDAELFLIVNL